MRSCVSCKVEKPLDCFHRRAASPGGYNTVCKACRAKIDRKSYLSNPRRAGAIKTDRQAAQKRNQDYVRDHLADHPCVDCGETDILVLDYDHLGDKVAGISVMIKSGWALTRLVAEIEKCEVRCANCHRRKTAERHGAWWRAVPR